MAPKRELSRCSNLYRKKRKVSQGQGQVLTIGDGSSGQLGNGFGTTDLEQLEVVSRLLNEDTIQVAGGGMHSLCLTKNGQVFSFGCNDQGALGRMTSSEIEWFTPSIVPRLERYHVREVSCGDSHSSALTTNGRVFIWGTFRQSDGECHLLGPISISTTPIELFLPHKAIQVSSGNNHLLVLTEDKQIYSIGSGENGQLGRIPSYYFHNDTYKDTTDCNIKKLMFWPSPVFFPEETKIEKLWAGSYNSFSLSTTGDIYAWGLNNRQQLCFHDRKDRYFPHVWELGDAKIVVEEIAGGDRHTLVMDKIGHVYSIGDGIYGQLGLKSKVFSDELVRIADLNPCSSISAGLDVSYAVTRDGELYAWGMAGSHIGSPDVDLTTPKRMFCFSHVKKVSTRGLHSIILTGN